MVAVLVQAQGKALAGVQIEEAGQAVVDAQGVHQLHLPALGLHPLLLLPQLLGGAVQQEALVEHLPVLLHQLDVAHHVEDLQIGRAHV